MFKKLSNYRFLGLLFLVSCAGMERDCSSGCNSSFGADWVVLQYGYDGTPINCWKLTNTAISNESQTDGIFWQSSSGNLVHISGWYNRVQVSAGQWPGAAQQLGIDMAGCTEGRYVKSAHGNAAPEPTVHVVYDNKDSFGFQTGHDPMPIPVPTASTKK